MTRPSSPGYREAAMVGDVLWGHLRAKGVVAVVCDGSVRGTGTLRGEDDFPVFSRWINPRGPIGADRGAVNLPCWSAACTSRPASW